MSPASFARSIAASVWPARTRTPPSLAISGKTWPGLTSRRGPGSGRWRPRPCAPGRAPRCRSYPFSRFDRDGEGGAVARAVVPRHGRQAQLTGPLAGDRQADQAARVHGHEVDLLRRGHLRRDYHVAFVLTVFRVDQDAGRPCGLLDDVLDRRDGARRFAWERRFRPFPASAPRSGARTSISRLTLEPGRAARAWS